MFQWAKELETQGLVRLLAYRGASGVTTLLPYLADDNAGFLTVWNGRNECEVTLWRTVFERRIPELIPTIEALTAPVPLGQGKVIKSVSEELLSALSEAYKRSSTPRATET
jgi:hypothetical protein